MSHFLVHMEAISKLMEVGCNGGRHMCIHVNSVFMSCFTTEGFHQES